MKKLICLTAVIVAAALILTGCGSSEGGSTGQGGTGPIDPGSFATLGDVLSIETDEFERTVMEGKVVYAFGVEGQYYRVTAPITKEQFDAIMDIDISDDDAEQRMYETLSPLEITSVVDLNEFMLSPQDLEALAGKTGQELMDEGWYVSMGYNLADMIIYMNFDPFCYAVSFDGEVPQDQFENFDPDEDLREMKVVKAEFMCLGQATYVEE